MGLETDSQWDFQLGTEWGLKSMEFESEVQLE
jgi:hypothetical protein